MDNTLVKGWQILFGFSQQHYFFLFHYLFTDFIDEPGKYVFSQRSFQA